MTEIYLIRHTQAEGNLYRMMQGHWDGDVTALGWREIEALAERFRDVPVDAVYSSDLYRARMTAGAVTRWKQLPLRLRRDLREIHMGRWEAQFFGNVWYEEPEATEAFLHDQDRWQVEGSETYAQVRSRACAALLDIARAHPGQTVAVVSHGVTIRCLLSAVTGISLTETKKLPIGGNTAVSHLTYEDGRFTVDYLNDDSHLQPLRIPHWSLCADLRHVPLDPARDAAYYDACYADAWRASHGDLAGYRAESYLRAARQHRREDPGAVLRMLDGEKSVGLVDLDTRRGAAENYGWISLLYLCPEYRHKGYGVQLLGRAVARYGALGRDRLRLTVAEENAPARAFYAKYGFAELERQQAARGAQLLLEKKLEARHG